MLDLTPVTDLQRSKRGFSLSPARGIAIYNPMNCMVKADVAASGVGTVADRVLIHVIVSSRLGDGLFIRWSRMGLAQPGER